MSTNQKVTEMKTLFYIKQLSGKLKKIKSVWMSTNQKVSYRNENSFFMLNKWKVKKK